eukprot:CAMPEP_0172506918 /NCGR_PEP_ID=MMETSP1066-20121228/199582_1 /TAXON_ID=671091 /ORGANISM="Coscinodiscus wailesii, Strain CCMP2513" /LENGTH=921 /DNA_ID=CAMNT_0013284207 /DNA_START=183 /DNA_END=2948 /DNA_ORIENTATION=-
MGLLKVGTPQPWEKSKSSLHYIRKAGVRQFISTYNRVKNLKGDELLWGDEIEYGVFTVSPQDKKLRLCLRGREIMDELNRREASHRHRTEGCQWVPEYGAWMVEATPNRPYTGYTNDLLRVERNMRLRRKRILSVLHPDEIAPTVSAFPLLGTLGDDGSVPATPVGGSKSESAYIGDGIINPHPRFGTLTANIRKRRGEKVSIRVPLFRDVNTPEYADLKSAATDHGCCGSDSLQLWRYGKGDASREKYGEDFVTVGCSTSTSAEEDGEPVTNQKWLVNVMCEGCLGLFYRSAPGKIVPDADWPRNGEIVVGSEVPDIPGWIRLQNGYYLPMESDDKTIRFLHKVNSRIHVSNEEQRNIGYSTPLFRRSVASSKEVIEGLGSGGIDISDGMGNIAVSNLLDEKNLLPKVEDNDLDRVRAAIHMDAMAFGMGCCCVQVTFQAEDIDESRFIYDQLAVLAPIMMALTASTPILKGRLADTDCRWGIISESVDCRTPAERGLKGADAAPQKEYAGRGVRRIYKSRYDCISTYIYQGTGVDSVASSSLRTNGKPTNLSNRILNMYNDIPVPIDEESYELLRAAGIDPALSQHIAHLFIRDPLVVFDGAVEEVDDDTQTEHFESIQSTNWQTVRWKPPPPRDSPNSPHIGWRTEFRSMEMQLTDFENAAFTVFIVLLTRVILTFDLNLYIPISRVDANMQRAHSRGAASKGKFFFRRHMAPLEEGDDGYGVKYSSMFARVNSTNDLSAAAVVEPSAEGKRKHAPYASGGSEENSYEEMSMEQIMMGKGDYFPGLIPLVWAYLEHINCDTATKERLGQYLDLIQKRATGELDTAATWMRKFVRGHPAYKKDSVVSSEIAYDLMIACKEIGEGERHVPELLGDLRIKPIKPDGSWDVKLDSKTVRNDDILELLRRYTNRKSHFSVNSE